LQVRPGSDYEINISSAQVARTIKGVERFERAAKGGTLTGTVGGVGLMCEVFAEAFSEVAHMLAQNLLSRVQARDDFQAAMAARVIMKEG
jgi:hypothetical protein